MEPMTAEMGEPEPTEATLDEHRRNIESLIDVVAIGEASVRRELGDALTAYESDTRQVAVRRQGKVMLAAILGDLTFFEGDEPVWMGETHFHRPA